MPAFFVQLKPSPRILATRPIPVQFTVQYIVHPLRTIAYSRVYHGTYIRGGKNLVNISWVVSALIPLLDGVKENRSFWRKKNDLVTARS